MLPQTPTKADMILLILQSFCPEATYSQAEYIAHLIQKNTRPKTVETIVQRAMGEPNIACAQKIWAYVQGVYGR